MSGDYDPLSVRKPVPPAAAEKPPVKNDTAAELRQFIERVERLHEERRTIDDDVKDIYGEARGRGYDVKTMKRVIAARRKDRNERLEEDHLFETYMRALGEHGSPRGED